MNCSVNDLFEEVDGFEDISGLHFGWRVKIRPVVSSGAESEYFVAQNEY